jgi:hypothetical protein
MLEELQKIAGLTDSERESFMSAMNTLFTGSFIVRSVESHASLYRFVSANFSLFEVYLSLAGWSLLRDDSLGVIAWHGPPSSRFQFNKEESISLLILRLLYEEKAASVTLHGERTILQQEFQDKYRILMESSLKKTRLVSILRRFQSLKLVKVLGEEGDPETVIVLYASLPFALGSVAIDDIYQRISQYKGPAEAQDEGESDDELSLEESLSSEEDD